MRSNQVQPSSVVDMKRRESLLVSPETRMRIAASPMQVGSVTSYMNGVLELSEQAQKQKRRQRTELAKMLLVIAFPVCALLTVTSLSLDTAFAHLREVQKSEERLEANLQLVKLMEALQEEKSLSAVFVASGLDYGTSNSLREMYIVVDNLVRDVTESQWPTLTLQGAIVTSQSQLIARLQAERSITTGRSALDKINFYNNLSGQLLKRLSSELPLPRGSIWRYYVALVSLTSAMDVLSVQRALCASMIASCSLEGIDWLQELDIKYKLHLETAFGHEDSLQSLYNSIRATHTEELSVFNDYKDKLLGGNLSAVCGSSQQEDLTTSLNFFNSAKILTNDVLDLTHEMTSTIQLTLSDINTSVNKEVVLQTCVMVFCTVLGFVITAWYVTCVNKLTQKITNIALASYQKSQELSVEKKRTEQLLYEILPKDIARKHDLCKI